MVCKYQQIASGNKLIFACYYNKIIDNGSTNGDVSLCKQVLPTIKINYDNIVFCKQQQITSGIN